MLLGILLGYITCCCEQTLVGFISESGQIKSGEMLRREEDLRGSLKVSFLHFFTVSSFRKILDGLQFLAHTLI